MKPRLSVEAVDEICQWYQDGEPAQEIKKAYGVSYQSIYYWLKQRGISAHALNKLKPMTNLVFGRLTVLSREEKTYGKNSMWLCRCECGTEKVVNGCNLRMGLTKSCGCYGREQAKNRHITHGLNGTPKYKMWISAKCRAKKKGIEFNLTLDDIIIPERCPITGRLLQINPKNGIQSKDSPSLDKINNDLGYIKGNVAVISYGANKQKSDMTLDEVNRLRDYMMSHNPKPVAVD